MESFRLTSNQTEELFGTRAPGTVVHVANRKTQPREILRYSDIYRF